MTNGNDSAIASWLGRTGRYGCALLLAIAALGCSQPIYLSVQGRLSTMVEFELRDSPTAPPVQANVTEFLVQEQNASGGWTAAWEIRGHASLERISYGKSPAGMSVEREPVPLRANGKYRAFVTVDSLFSRRGDTVFHTDAAGSVIVK